MRELEGRSYVEIGDTLGVSVAAVEALIFRARRSLRVRASALRSLATVPLPASLAQLFEGGGVVAGGIGAGFLVKAAVALVAGSLATGLPGDHAKRAVVVGTSPEATAGTTASSVAGRQRLGAHRTAAHLRIAPGAGGQTRVNGGSLGGSASQPDAGAAQQSTLAPTAATATTAVTDNVDSTVTTVEQTVTSATSTLPVQPPPLPPLPVQPPPLPNLP
jgi:hypothetical protein